MAINIRVVTPTKLEYTIDVEGSICRHLINVFEEIKDIELQSWIYERLNDQIVHSLPFYSGSYLGYIWYKVHEKPQEIFLDTAAIEYRKDTHGS